MKWTIKFNRSNLNGDKVIIEGNGGEESGAIIEVQSDLICLYEIPQYGGFPRSAGTYKNIIEAMKIAESWT